MALKKKKQEAQVVLSEDERAIANIEKAFDAADAAEVVDRKKITQAAQLDVAEAVALTGVAMEADEAAMEASRMAMLAERSGNRAKAKVARTREREARKQARHDHRAATRSARRAFEAVKFSNPNSYGFLWVIMVILGLSIVYTVATLTTYIKGNYTIDYLSAVEMLNVLFNGVTLWLIWKRKKMTRYWVFGVSAFNILSYLAVYVPIGAFDWLLFLAHAGFAILMIVYFAISHRVAGTLIEPFNTRALRDDLDYEASFTRPKTWEFWRNLIMYFIIFSIVGHWMEAGVCLLIKYGIVPGTYDPTSQIWSDWLYPFPVYGIGFCVCAILLYPIKNWLQGKVNRVLPALILSFLVNGFACSLIEFVMGLAVNADLQLWDYSDMFCNIMGQVCLQNTLFFGFVATIMTWIIYPALENLFRTIPNEYANGIFVAVLVGFIVLYALYYINIPVPDVESIGATAAMAPPMLT